MKRKNIFGGVMFFLAGLLTAVIFQFFYPDPKDAWADQYSCIRQDLDAYGYNGNIPNPQFTIIYNVPSCYASNGYRIEKVYIYGSQVAVTYKNPNAVSSKLFGGSQESGGMSTIP